MNKYIPKLTVACTFVLFIGMLALTPACHKDKPCKAVVTVLDAATGAPIVGATVELDPDGTGTGTQISPVQESTDASGKANFETALPKIMDIKVIFTSTYNTGKVVRFESGKTDEVTVKI
ncbi:MAG: hypothetical protein HY064_10785 [Bacteroidetes bacterium]|nr:hypothetical protein [Bacteroidota bacterium]